MFNISNIFKDKSIQKAIITKDQIAELLKTTPNMLEQFEQAYHNIENDKDSDNFFDLNAKDMAEQKAGIESIQNPDCYDTICNAIVKELLAQTPIWEYDTTGISTKSAITEKPSSKITMDDLYKLPPEIRPQLTGSLMKRDISEPAYIMLLNDYHKFLNAKNPKMKQQLYHHFRQGLDLLDLDHITYEMLGMNPNAMGYWLPKITDSVQETGFFKIPKTVILKVPLTMLQLARISYEELNRTTLDIVNEIVAKAAHLDETKSYFIKTGTYSSKYDFRNAKVTGPKEVRELGEYLLFINHYANRMSSPTNNVSIYGVSTTNEWVIREYIEDKENNPCIYHGMPLHTEYRAFVDFDTKEILGISPYWKPEVMKKRFSEGSDAENPTMKHDYIIYSMAEETLMSRYHENKDRVVHELQKVLDANEDLSGQWSIDIMQNGDDFWLIDMALAINSALSECVPAGKLHAIEENWIPQLS